MISFLRVLHQNVVSGLCKLSELRLLISYKGLLKRPLYNQEGNNHAFFALNFVF